MGWPREVLGWGAGVWDPKAGIALTGRGGGGALPRPHPVVTNRHDMCHKKPNPGFSYTGCRQGLVFHWALEPPLYFEGEESIFEGFWVAV